MTDNKTAALSHIREMNAAMIERVKAKDNDALDRGMADDSPLLKALESRNVTRIARKLKYWHEQTTKNGHYKKGGHRFLVNLIERLQELFPGDENGTYIGRIVQMPQPKFTYHLLAGISYKVCLASAFNREGDQSWSPLNLADKVRDRMEVALVDLYINRVSSQIGGSTSNSLNKGGHGFGNRKEAWKRVREYAVEEALEHLSTGKKKVTATEAGLETLKAPLDAMFPPDVDSKGRKLYDLKMALLFVITDVMCYHRDVADEKYDANDACHFPFVMTRQDPTNKYSQREIRLNPAIKAAKDAVLERIMLDDAKLEPNEDEELLPDFCFVFKAVPYEPTPWRYTGKPDRVNKTGGFNDDALRSLCALHKKRGSEADTISSKERIDFVNALQACAFEVNRPVLELAKHLHNNQVTIDGLASRHAITEYDAKIADDAACTKDTRIEAKRKFLREREKELVERGIVLPADAIPTEDIKAHKNREALIREYRNGTQHGVEWRKIRKGVEALIQEIRSQNDNAVTTSLSLEELSRLSELEKFFYVTQLDARGRIYYVSSNSSPLSGNLNRWCHQFHDGETLTDKGWDELKLAIGTAILGNKLSINSRRAYAEENLEKFITWGQDLIEYWDEIRELKPDEFWMTCALLSGLAEYQQTKVWKVPVSRDAAASGLGWWSVLTGDESGARVCNLIDTDEDSTAGDAYRMMLEIVKEWVDSRSPDCLVARKIGNSKKVTRKKFTADEWQELDELFADLGKLRKAAKITVMIGSYGASSTTIQKDVAEAMPELSDFQQAFLALNLVRAMQEVFSGCYETMLTLKDAYTGVLNSQASEETENLMDAIGILRKELLEQVKAQKLFAKDYEPTDTDELFDVLGEYESKKVSPIKAKLRVLEHQLAELRYKDEMEQGPITWQQVDGTIIHHCKLLQTISNLSLPGHGELKFCKFHEHTRDGQKGRVAVAPDFIHSCDSQQLAMAYRQFYFPAYAIHDCTFTHPNNMGAALSQLKEAMIAVVKDNPLVRLLNDWGVDYQAPVIENLEERIRASALYWN